MTIFGIHVSGTQLQICLQRIETGPSQQGRMAWPRESLFPPIRGRGASSPGQLGSGNRTAGSWARSGRMLHKLKESNRFGIHWDKALARHGTASFLLLFLLFLSARQVKLCNLFCECEKLDRDPSPNNGGSRCNQDTNVAPHLSLDTN